jgi:hypothetical protein
LLKVLGSGLDYIPQAITKEAHDRLVLELLALNAHVGALASSTGQLLLHLK